MTARTELEAAAMRAVAVLRATSPLTVLPSTRIDLEKAARDLEEALARRPSLETAETIGEVL